jgi:hypothetical protein
MNSKSFQNCLARSFFTSLRLPKTDLHYFNSFYTTILLQNGGGARVNNKNCENCLARSFFTSVNLPKIFPTSKPVKINFRRMAEAPGQLQFRFSIFLFATRDTRYDLVGPPCPHIHHLALPRWASYFISYRYKMG